MKELFRSARTTLAIVVLATAVMVAGCENINPFAAAQTIEQKSYAVQATYNILLNQAITLIQNPAIGDESKSKVFDAERATTPIVKELAFYTQEYITVKKTLAEGGTTEENLLILADNLEAWITTAEKALDRLSSIIKSQ